MNSETPNPSTQQPGGQPSGDQPSGAQPSGDQPSGDQQTNEALGSDPRSIWQRIGRDFRTKRREQLVAAVLVGGLGFATVVQIRASNADDTYAGLRSADLVQVLNGLTAESRRADNELANLERTKRELTDSTQQREAAQKRAEEQSDTLGILAGTVGAEGPGIRIKVTDPEGKLTLNNLLDGVQELRSARAEAMEFNDSVRVVAQTSFEQTSEGILVSGRQVAAPYVIDVIGDPDALAESLEFVGGFKFDVEADGGEVAVQRLKKVQVTSTVPLEESDFAQPDPAQ